MVDFFARARLVCGGYIFCQIEVLENVSNEISAAKSLNGGATGVNRPSHERNERLIDAVNAVIKHTVVAR